MLDPEFKRKATQSCVARFLCFFVPVYDLVCSVFMLFNTLSMHKIALSCKAHNIMKYE